MTVKERLKKYIEYKGLSMRKFCLSIGVSTGYVNNINQSIQPAKIDSITIQYPDLNTGWLLTGEGSMLKDELVPTDMDFDKKVEVSAEAWEIIKKQADSLASKDRQMEELISLLKKASVPKEEDVTCAAASGSDLEK